MKLDITEQIEFPNGIQVKLNPTDVVASLNGKQVKKHFLVNEKIHIELVGSNVIKISAKKASKRELKLINSFVAHMKNIINGLNKEYVYTLEVCNVHFPVTVKTEGDKFKIKNFLGEKIERIANILPNTKVEIKGTTVTVTSPDIEAAGQTAANIEIATKIRNRDRRVFQDGIFITSKPGRDE
jgi:large subunit ribosomal protein L6